MSLLFLPEHAVAARIALELAHREVSHLKFTHHRLFLVPPTLSWVNALSDTPLDAERLDAFVGRFARLQDHLGDKLLPRFSELVGAAPRSLLDAVLAADDACKLLYDTVERVHSWAKENDLLQETA